MQEPISPAPQPAPAYPLTARISREWKKRMIMIMLFITGSGLWFGYDAALGYPQNNVRFAEFELIKAQHPEDEAGAEEGWQVLAEQKGWGKKPPKKAYSAQDIAVQWGIAGTALAGVGVMLVFFFMQLPRTLSSDGIHITGADGTKVPILNIKSVDKRKWKDQGIALIRYQTAQGLKRFVLDDYKFIGADKILADAEATLKADREKRAASNSSNG